VRPAVLQDYRQNTSPQPPPACSKIVRGVSVKNGGVPVIPLAPPLNDISPNSNP
jgi:hypothetical protein